MAITDTITDAISTSIREDRTVTVHCTIEDVIVALIGTTYDYDYADEHDGSTDVWGWTDDTPEDEHVWRLSLV